MPWHSSGFRLQRKAAAGKDDGAGTRLRALVESVALLLFKQPVSERTWAGRRFRRTGHGVQGQD